MTQPKLYTFEECDESEADSKLTPVRIGIVPSNEPHPIFLKAVDPKPTLEDILDDDDWEYLKDYKYQYVENGIIWIIDKLLAHISK